MSGLFGGGKKATSHATRAMGIDFQGAQYGPVIPVVYGRNKVPGNCIWYGDFQSHAQQQKAGKGGGGGGTTNYTYSASAQMGLCEGPVTGLRTVYDGTSVVNLSSINYAFASGAIGQAPWSHLSGSAALGYSLTAIFSFQNLDLGSQASLPNYNYELDGLKQYSGSIPDANPKDILSDICSDPYHGVNFPYLGNLTQYSNYCVANGLFLSPVYDQQQSANQTLSDLFKYTNAYAYYSEDQLKVVPLGDTAVTGNGVTFTPNVTPVVNLGTDDFIPDGEGGPSISIDRKAPQDNLNLVRVEFKDRANTYHDSAAVAAIDEDIITNGGRSDDSETVNGCTTAAVARFIAQNLVQRAFYVRNTYQFKLTWRYCYLEPTDIVTLTDAALGLSLYPVRITEIEEDGESALTITAEEFPEGIGHSAIYNTQPNGGTNIDQNSDPGAVNPPFLFRGPGFLVTGSNPEIWCAVNGSNAMWAGCEVYLSHDGTSYTFAGTVASQARYGSLTAALAAGTADPDITNTPTVQVYAPAELLGGSQTDADNFVTLAMVDTEVIAYETATLQSANTYQLGYLRRGGYGSANVAHNAGAPFVRLDDSIFRMPVDPSLIGSTVYLKFLSINAFGRTPRTLADETAYTYVVGTNVELPDVPDVPASFAVQGVADGVSVTWTNDNPAAVGCTSIERATASGGPWTVLAQVGPTTTAYHDSFTNGATYYYRARARGPLVQSGWSAYTDVYSSTGVDVSDIANTANTALNNGDGGQLINPQFNLWGANGSFHGWTTDNGTWGWQSGTNGPLSGTSSYSIRTGSSGTPNDVVRNQGRFPVYPNAVIKASCLVRGIGANGTCQVRVSWRDKTDTEISVTHGNAVTGTTTATSSVSAAAPNNPAICIAHIEADALSHTTGTYAVDNFTASSTADSMDQVPDGITRYGAAYPASVQAGMYGPGANLIMNPSFQLGMMDWALAGGPPSWSAASALGEPCALFNPTGTPTTAVGSSNVVTGLAAGVALSASMEVALNANLTGGDVSADVQFQNSGGTNIGASARIFTINGTFSGFLRQTLQNIICPANTAQAYIRYYTENATATSAAIRIRRVKLELGATATPFNDAATQHGNKLTQTGSGQGLGDQRNVPSSLTSNLGLVRSATALTAHAGGAVDVNAHSIQLGSAPPINYNAVTNAVTGLTASTGYYLYTNDNYAGGTQTWNATTSATTANNADGRYNAGFVTIPTSGTSGGGGGGGACVCADMYLRPGLTARDLARRWRWWKPWLWFLRGHDGWHLIRWRPYIVQEPCVRITVADGEHVDCSIHTPVTTRTGESVQAPLLYRHMIATESGWQRVIEVEALARLSDVVRINCGGHNFYAGANQRARISTHNWNK